MMTQCMTINNVRPDLVRSAAQSVQARYAEHDGRREGHRTRPGLSPLQAAADMVGRSADADQACVVYDDSGAILAVRYRPDAGRHREPWEGTAIAGHPDDELYRRAYRELFSRAARPAPDTAMPIPTPEIRPPKDPRPVEDGWTVSLWFCDRTQGVANATRIVVRRYEDYLNPDLANHDKQACVIRMANAGE